ncbi:inorganic pyrophosphatase [Deinococcus peraridilitoris]|uniref:Inorganic pyrophosphatase n=1 Tax=Deinococcus peraridilitoris (strain DSM 19664 / LMG 22246 / CIP 109416 / KR-200) TaxID=937777 RepID=L0A6R6_DEIPD|nr:inorganic pyrophosphatase [Deinococcus peraridilitoris]AFZ68882.1 inorganic pyrophosphatase [Deinococcus peraridilitoris DSM 19664]
MISGQAGALQGVRGVVEWRLGERRRFIWRQTESGAAVEFYREEPLPAPVNYGCLPGTRNPADEAEIDAVWLGPARKVGESTFLPPGGLLWLSDGDHKVIFGDPGSVAEGSMGSIQALLDWFPASRGARVRSAEAAWAWLRSLRP